jgi:hypothetical protein
VRFVHIVAVDRYVRGQRRQWLLRLLRLLMVVMMVIVLSRTRTCTAGRCCRRRGIIRCRTWCLCRLILIRMRGGVSGVHLCVRVLLNIVRQRLKRVIDEAHEAGHDTGGGISGRIGSGGGGSMRMRMRMVMMVRSRSRRVRARCRCGNGWLRRRLSHCLVVVLLVIRIHMLFLLIRLCLVLFMIGIHLISISISITIIVTIISIISITVITIAMIVIARVRFALGLQLGFGLRQHRLLTRGNRHRRARRVVARVHRRSTQTQ